MRRHYLWLVCLLLFIVQSTLMNWLLPVSWQTNLHVSPNFVLVAILYIALFKGRHYALVYGLIFGLLQDFMFYGHMIGAHSFAMGLTGYLTGLLQSKRTSYVVSTIFIIGLAYMAFETMLYGSFRLFNITHTEYLFALTHYTLPSALFNMMAGLVFYIPLRRLLDGRLPSKKEGDDA